MADSEPGRDEYTVGWVCALPIEVAAARAMLDRRYKSLPAENQKDSNTYVLGRVGGHNVVIASLPVGAYGTTSAAVTATNLLSSFPNIRFGLMVGIGGGIPSKDHDIRLGDIVVSQPSATSGGVVQYDLGKTTASGFTRTGSLNRPPTILLTALSNLQAEHILGSEQIPVLISKAHTDYPNLGKTAKHLGPENDKLFRPDYEHADEDSPSCQRCDRACLLSRETRENDDPVVHYGVIGSGNQVIKDGETRERMQREHGVLCFEMEAAGLMNDFPCLVVRGICDYSDSHKSKSWQNYAALTAGAYAKELLSVIHPVSVEAVPKAMDVLRKLSAKVDKISDNVQNSLLDRHDAKINHWLHPTDPSTNYHRAIDTRVDGSGSWFLQSDEYIRWKSSRSSLWLHGLPGCGKTILSSSIIKALRHDEDGTLIVLYFYFDFSDGKKQGLEAMACTIVSQLYCQSKSSQKILDSLFHKCLEGREKPSIKELLDTFTRMLLSEKEVFIVIDALDECAASRDNLTGWVRDFAHSLPEGVHLLVTSRKEGDIESKLAGAIDQIIAIQYDVIDKDIELYIRKRITEEDFDRWKDRVDVQNKIVDYLRKNSKGMQVYLNEDRSQIHGLDR